jgi:hypothetical protein
MEEGGERTGQVITMKQGKTVSLAVVAIHADTEHKKRRVILGPRGRSDLYDRPSA